MRQSGKHVRGPKVLAVTGGKGGVGKTSVSVNIAIALARGGYRVCLFDADTSLANVNIMMGIQPEYTLEHLFTGEKSIQDIVTTGPEGVQVVPGASGYTQCVDLNSEQQQRLVNSLRALEPHYDYMIVDTAAGIGASVLHFVAASQIAMVVVTPEPTSLTDAFSLLKVLKRRGYKRRVQVVVNMSPSASRAEQVYRRFRGAVQKYLRLDTEYLGSIWRDESMHTAVALQSPVALFPRNDPSARAFYRLAEQVENAFSENGVPTLPMSAYWSKVAKLSPQKPVHEKIPSKPFSVINGGASINDGELASASDSSKDLVSGSNVVSLNSGGDHSITQIQKQLKRHQDSQKMAFKLRNAKKSVDEDSARSNSAEADESIEVLTETSEQRWLSLRQSLNEFVADKNTTPEQVTTLLSSCILGYGERLGNASLDLVLNLLALVESDDINEEQALALNMEFSRLGLAQDAVDSQSVEDTSPSLADKKEESSTQSEDDGEVIMVDPEASKAQYDVLSFGNQRDLAERIRNTSRSASLEQLLRSIKHASLTGDSGDEL